MAILTQQKTKLTDKNWHIYLLRCVDNSLYCGISNQLSKRLQQHNGEISGGAKYTLTRRPCVLVYQENAKDRSAASKREYLIKKLSHSQKLALISTKTPL